MVPSIALLGQTLNEWNAQSEKPIKALCICSDAEVSKKKVGNDDSTTSVVDLAPPATTHVPTITQRFEEALSGEEGMTVVFSTSQLLILRNGIAILATHSPVVLQEIPSSCVSIINRSGQIIQVTRPEIETFAENIGILTQEVFRFEVRRSGFYKLLQKEVEAGLSYEEILDKFNQKIGLEGKVQLSALINEREQESGRNDFN